MCQRRYLFIAAYEYYYGRILQRIDVLIVVAWCFVVGVLIHAFESNGFRCHPAKTYLHDPPAPFNWTTIVTRQQRGPGQQSHWTVPYLRGFCLRCGCTVCALTTAHCIWRPAKILTSSKRCFPGKRNLWNIFYCQRGTSRALEVLLFNGYVESLLSLSLKWHSIY